MMQRLTGMVLATGAFVCAAGIAAVLGTGSAFATGLIPHRAIYDMELDEAKESSGIATLSGLMVYEFSGSECDGYSVSFRLVTEFRDMSGGSQVTDLRSTSFEAPKALSFQFLNKTYVNQKLIDRTRGTARSGDALKTVELQEPDTRSFSIARGALFPTEHLTRIIEAGRAGKSFLAADVFDGSETGDKVFATTAVIGAGKREVVPVSDAPAASVSRIGEAEVWPVSIAYFDPEQSKGGEQTPAYQIAFLLYDNGISRQIKMDYGEFSLKGRLRQLELLDEASCNN